MSSWPCNVLFYLCQFPAYGGVERVTASLCRLLRDDGFSVSVLSHRACGNDDLTRGLDGVPLEVMPDQSRPSSSANRAFLRDLLVRRAVDVLVFQDSYFPDMEKNLAVAKTAGVKIVAVEHGSPTIPLGDPALADRAFALKHPVRFLKAFKALSWTKRRHRAVYDASDRYVMLSARCFGELRWVAELSDARKLRAIPNVNTFSAPAAEPRKKNEVLFLGSLFRLKGVDMLLDAWHSVSSAFPEWTLRIVGDGPLGDALKRRVSSEKLSRVVFEGAHADVRPFLETAAVLAAPSRYEGFPMVLGEAMAYGAVPVCFDSYSSLRDVVTDGENGMIVPAFDVDAFARSLASLMSDDARRRAMAESARTSVARFSAERVLPMWRALFKEVLG